MGTVGQIFAGLAQGAKAAAEKQRQQADKSRDAQAAIYHSVLSNPNASEDQRGYAVEQLNKLYKVKENESPFSKAGGLIGKLGTHLQGGGKVNLPGLQAPISNASVADLPQLDSASANDQGQVSRQAPVATAPRQLPPLTGDPANPTSAPAATGVGQQKPNLLQKIGNAVQSTGRGIQSLTAPTNVPTIEPIDPRMIPSPALQPAKWNTTPSAGGELPADLESDVYGNPIDRSPDKLYTTGVRGGKVVAMPFHAKPGNGRGVPGHPISITDAQKLADSGQSFPDANGNPINTKDLSKTMQIVPIYYPGRAVVYGVTSQSQTHFNVGNEVYAVPTMEQTNLSSEGVPLGQARVPTAHSAPGIGLDGQIGIVTTTNSPSTPGARSNVGRSLPALPDGQTAPAPAPRPAGRSLTPLSTNTVPSTSGTNGQALPFSAANQLNQRIIPVREASTALFGSPDFPNLDPVAAFGKVASNPASANKVGAAVRTTLDRMGDDEKSAGGILQAISNNSGITAWKAQAANNALGNQLKQMTPEEQNAYNAIITAYSTIIGLRTLTKASAAQFSIKALENELPVPGLNSQSPAAFYDKIGRLGVQIYNGSKTLPISPEEKNLIKNGTDKYLNLGKGTTTKNGTEMDQKVYQGHTYERPKGSSDQWHLKQ